jgi:hypothetical protein
MRTAAFLRNVPILSGLPDELLERLARQANRPRVVELGRRAAREALEADPELLSRLGN